MFSGAVNNWLTDFANDAFGLFDRLMLDMLDTVFHAETLVASSGMVLLTEEVLQDVYSFIYGVACGLVVLKFLMKGFQIYILWRGGDADASPQDMLIGAGEAVVVMICFPWLYERAVDIFTFISDGIMGRLGAVDVKLGQAILNGGSAGGNIALIFGLVFLVLVFVLWIRLMMQGFELLVMRLGLPFATVGLIDSDMALFKSYIQVFFKTGFTVIIQISLMSLAVRLIASIQQHEINLFAAIALVSTALATPKLLSQFLTPQGGGGGLQKASSLAMVARSIKMLV